MAIKSNNYPPPFVKKSKERKDLPYSTDKTSALLSIIIPVYNVEQELSKCLESVLEQDYPSIEIIVVDDGSRDSSGFICDKFAHQDSRIRVFHKENGGLSSARNYGISRASGEYITFLDSDDWLENDVINKAMQYLNAYPDTDVLQFGITNYWSEDITSREQFQNFTLSSSREIYSEYVLKKRINQYAWGKIYHRSLFEGIEFPKDRYYEDVPTGFRILEKVKVFAGISDFGYGYRRYRADAITKRFDDRILDLHLNIHDLQREYAERNPELLLYINTMQVMHLRVNMVAAWEDKGKRKDWFRKFRPFIKEARKYPYIWGNKTERIHWGLFLKFPRLYLDLWSYYQSRK